MRFLVNLPLGFSAGTPINFGGSSVHILRGKLLTTLRLLRAYGVIENTKFGGLIASFMDDFILIFLELFDFWTL